MKYKTGDKVRIKSLDWYNENKDEYGVVLLENGQYLFFENDTIWCGKIITIVDVCLDEYYTIVEDHGIHRWTDDMIEGLVEEDTKPEFKDEESKKEVIAWMPNGKLVAEKFNDGTITTIIDKFKYTKVSINSEFCDDKVELVISPDFELKQEGDKWFAIKKKKEYPKTYEECVGKLPINWDGKVEGYKCDLLTTFQKLLICRDIYWKIAGEEMGLEKSWELSIGTPIYYIYYNRTVDTIKNDYADDIQGNVVLAFPTEEMRDAFYENFKDLIEQCKELL